MKVDFADPAPPASEEQIAAVESSLDLELASSYKAFLRRQNGGYMASNSFSGDLGASVRYFYSAGETPVEHLEDLVSIASLYSPGGEADYVLRPGVLPIGEDDGGNLICLDVGAGDPGAVYFWEHEILPEDAAYTRLADDVDALIEALEPR